MNLESPYKTASAVTKTIELLKGAGFQQLDKPYRIGDTDFEFGTPFVSSNGYLDLVLVQELGAVSEEILWNLKNIAQALDVAGSSMALTLVAVGKASGGISSFREAQALARVLVVDTNQSLLSVEEQIAPLLPLRLQSAVQETLEDPMQSLHGLAKTGHYSRFLQDVIHKSQDGREIVEQSLLDWLEEPMTHDTAWGHK